MQIYVAGKSGEGESERCAAFMARLRKLGHAITHDWTKDVDAHERQAFSSAQLTQAARNDIDAVRRSDAVILLWHPRLRGALVELGAGLVMLHPVLAVGVPATETNIFFKLCNHVDTEDEAIAFLPKLQALAAGL